MNYHHGPIEPDPIMNMLKTHHHCDPSISIAYDQWARTRLICDHGTFEAVSDMLNLTQSFRRALKVYNSYPHPPRCYKQTDIPEGWKKDPQWEGKTTECDLWRDHKGECIAYEDWTEDDAQRTTIYRKLYNELDN